MKRIWTVLAAACLLLIATDGARAISSPSGIDSRLRFEYEVGRTRHGQPEIQGYIYNDYGRPASDVVLYVESLDGSGAVVGHTYGFIRGVVQITDRAYFEIPVRAAGASYRVSVTALDWKGGGGM